MKTNRREFIKVIAGTSTIILMPSILNAKNENTSENSNIEKLSRWTGHNKMQKDIRLNVLSYAILAANPHNKQPWLIDLINDDQLDLYVDQARLLPKTDPFYRQIHISQGTFLENLSLAASYFGYETIINYFPNGEYSNEVTEDKILASVKLIKNNSIKKDELFDFILQRHSNKREYNKELVSNEILQKISKEMNKTLEESHSFSFTNKKEDLKNLRKIAVNAMKIEAADKNRDLETIEMFRFNDGEVKKYRDGFGLAQNGVSGVKKILLETFFISRENAIKKPHSFGKEGVEIIKKQVASTHTFAWLKTKTNTRLDQVKIGRVYERLNLFVASLGLVMHPISQILEEYPAMLELQNFFLEKTNTNNNQTVQMFFRIGYAKETVHTARREIKNIIIT